MVVKKIKDNQKLKSKIKKCLAQCLNHSICIGNDDVLGNMTTESQTLEKIKEIQLSFLEKDWRHLRNKRKTIQDGEEVAVWVEG